MIPSTPITFWQYFDLFTLSTLTVVIGLLLASHHKARGSLLKTISETVAHTRKSSLIFSITMSICFPLYYAFMWFWVAPLTKMPTGFYFLLATSAFFELVFVWVPSKAGKKKIVHEIAAGFVGIAMLIMPILILLYGDGLTDFMKGILILFFAMTTTLAVSLSQIKLRRHLFLFETVYLVTFLTTISVIAHS
jgi:hypothetical protein